MDKSLICEDNMATPTLNIKIINEHRVEFTSGDVKVIFDSSTKELTYEIPNDRGLYLATDTSLSWVSYPGWININSEIRAISFGRQKEHILITFDTNGGYELSANYSGSSWSNRGSEAMELVSDIVKALSTTTMIEHVTVDISDIVSILNQYWVQHGDETITEPYYSIFNYYTQLETKENI